MSDLDMEREISSHTVLLSYAVWVSVHAEHSL